MSSAKSFFLPISPLSAARGACLTAATLGACGSATSREILREATVYVESEGAYRQPGQPQTGGARRGSGVFIDDQGHIVTNNHVVGGSAIRHVYVGDERHPRVAELLGLAECSDLALLKINALPGEFTYVDWALSPVGPGRDVMAAGFPASTGDRTYTLTEGTISTEPQPLATSWASVGQAIYHTAQINTGNSGGPLITSDGAELVGINYAGSTRQGTNIAISATEAAAIVEQLRTQQNVHSLGIHAEALPEVDALGNVVSTGIWVSAVEAGRQADAIRLRPGDVILSLAGVDLADPTDPRNHTMQHYCDLIRSNDPNHQVLPIRIFRPDAQVVCEGQINGRELYTAGANGQAIPCPLAGGTTPPPGPHTGANAGIIPEQEPNESLQAPHVLTLPALVQGVAKQGDPAMGWPASADGPADPFFVEDLYGFVLSAPTQVAVELMTQGNADLDLYLFTPDMTIVGRSTSENSGHEGLQGSLQPGHYLVGVDAWDGVVLDAAYQLRIQNF